MACNVPGASTLEAFWHLLAAGEEAITFLSEEELRRAGVDPDTIADPNYVPARGILDDAELFDAEFFGMSPREAALTDPQHRHFLECAWAAIEDAGYDPRALPGNVGVFAGSGWNSYLIQQLAGQAGLLGSDAGHQVLIGNEKDNLTTRLSYKLNLTGPSLAIQTGCSSSLVAISMACQSLLDYQSDMSIAGGVSITAPQAGYLHRQGGILSKDGHCRAFDAASGGTVLGNGVGVVALKRLDDALADGDHIYAVIKGTAINNDGARKAGFTAPSVDGQASCITECHAVAGITSDSISYVEAHGTGTEVGDPIEVAALQKAFGQAGATAAPCLLGSVKTNIGHLDAAAGVAGLIKVALMLHHEEMVPSLHFSSPNPNIDFQRTRFQVSTTRSPWLRHASPRRAGVSSFGLGGTNAHAVLEEAPLRAPHTPAAGPHLLVLSARSASALQKAAQRLAAHLHKHPGIDLADVAYTLSVGRSAFDHRRFVVASDTSHAIAQLEADDPAAAQSAIWSGEAARIAFMFPGQGSQHPGMAAGMYRADPVFRRHLDHCLEILSAQHGLELGPALCTETPALVPGFLDRTDRAQPALFCVSYAIARSWIDAGAVPHGALGHSIGEFVAATLAGVFSLDDALGLVVARGRLMLGASPGAMLAVALPREQLGARLPAALDIAAVNETHACVVAGEHAAIASFEAELANGGVAGKRLNTSHAFHSRMMDPVVDAFVKLVAALPRSTPTLRFVSNVTGDWITDAQAIDPAYWGKHLRQTVQFADGMQTLLGSAADIVLECGPGHTLSQFARRHPARASAQRVLTSQAMAGEAQDMRAHVLQQLGFLWLSGAALAWPALHAADARRVRLPSYPFERQRHWIDQATSVAAAPLATPSPAQIWESLLHGVETSAETILATFDRPHHARRKRALDLLCVGYINQAMQDLGLFADPDAVFTQEQLEQCSGVSPRFQQLFVHMLSTLHSHGQLTRKGDVYSALQGARAATIAALETDARSAWAGEEEVIDLAKACGEALVEVLRGKKSPLELFSTVLAKVQAPVQAGASLHAAYNAIIRAGIDSVLARLPARAPIRVFEMGGGTGVATSSLLPVLPAARTRYMFTDIGAYFVSKARQKFSQYPFVDFSTLNVDMSPQEQGFGSHCYDIVIAVNMLHVTRNMDSSLQHARSLLAPGGLLLIWEITRCAPDFDVTYGLLMEAIHDGERNQGDPFLDGAGWTRTLLANGFSQVSVLPQDGFFEEQVIIAQADQHSDGILFALPPAGAAEAATPTLLDKKTDIGQWFHEISWQRHSRTAGGARQARHDGPCLLLGDGARLTAPLAEQLRQRNETVIEVRRGQRFERVSDTQYVICADKAEHFAQLLVHLRQDGRTPARIVHCWGTDAGEAGLVDAGLIDDGKVGDDTLEGGRAAAAFGHFHGLLYLAQAIGEHLPSAPIALCVVTDDLHHITGSETITPIKSLLLGFVRVVGLEYPQIRCRNIDVSLGGAQCGVDLPASLAEEVLAPGAGAEVVALRGAHRWVQCVAPLPLPASEAGSGAIRERGVYLITGGLGKVGLAIASHLAQTARARLVLVSRTALPPQQEWRSIAQAEGDSSHLGRITAQLLALQERGAELLVTHADVADPHAMRQVVDAAERAFGTINGVIHSAGMLGDGAMQTKTVAQINDVLRAKVSGTLVLDSLFASRQLDFLMLFSSLSALKPGFGQLAYCAANTFIDGFCQMQASYPIRCISWDVWQGDGMAYDAAAPALIEQIKQSDFRQRGLTAAEGIEVFRRALESRHTHLLVCTSSYLMADDQQIIDIYTAQARALAAVPGPKHSGSAAALALPATEIEHTLTELWVELLGIRSIGIEDDFFALGGDSLIGTLLVSRVFARLGVRLPTRSVYECRTIRAFGQAVEEALLAEASADDLNELLRELQQA